MLAVTDRGGAGGERGPHLFVRASRVLTIHRKNCVFRDVALSRQPYLLPRVWGCVVAATSGVSVEHGGLGCSAAM